MHQAIYEKLKEVARARSKITYGELAKVFGFNAHLGSGRIFAEICENEYHHGRPLLAAVVVRKKEGMPGKGFFKVARRLGAYQGSDDTAFWRQELGKVHDYWSSPLSPSL